MKDTAGDHYGVYPSGNEVVLVSRYDYETEGVMITLDPYEAIRYARRVIAASLAIFDEKASDYREAPSWWIAE